MTSILAGQGVHEQVIGYEGFESGYPSGRGTRRVG